MRMPPWALLRRATLLGAAGVALALGAARAQSPAEVRDAPKAVIAVEDDWPPFAWVPKKGAPVQGFAVELVRRSFEHAGVPVELRVMPFARCMHEAQSGKVVACFNSLRLPENASQFLWPSQPLFREPLAIFARVPAGAPRPRSATTVDDLAGKRVGYHQSYHYAEWFTAHPTIVRVAASDDVALMRMLNAGRIDYALFGASAGAWRLHSDPSLRSLPLRQVGQEQSNAEFWIAFSRQHPDAPALLERFDRGLRAVKAGPQWAELHRQHLPGTPP